MISPETIARIKALMEEASVYEDDLEESFVLGGGPGGQKTNKTSNVVRLVHEPSGLMTRCGETRSRETNRWLARRTIAEMILDRAPGGGENTQAETPPQPPAEAADARREARPLGDQGLAPASGRGVGTPRRILVKYTDQRNKQNEEPDGGRTPRHVP